MSRTVARREMAAVFLMSLGSMMHYELLTVIAAAVAPLFAGYVLLRGMLLAERLAARSALPEAGGLWLALNVVPMLVSFFQPEPQPMWPGLLKSFFWMMLLTLAMLAGADLGPRASASRLLSTLGAVFGLVAGSALLLAPAGAVAVCPGGACFKPLVGYSVLLLDAIEREEIVVHVPALPGADDHQ